jgi:DNA modification methylase
MAAADREQLDALLREVQSGEAGVQAMLSELAQGAGVVPPEEMQPAEPQAERPSLSERFIVPPFSVLDARQGYWQERKRAWLSLGIQSELGRGENALGFSKGVNERHGDGSGPYAKRPNATPGGSPRPAASLGPDGKTVRGDGRGRVLARSNGQDLMRGEHTLGAIPPNERAILARSGKYAGRPPHGPRVTQNADGSLAYRSSNNGEGASGTSIFDPVLCELAYRWFSPPGGVVLDPFAGGSVRGVVAAILGRAYVGIDLRAEQVEANEVQAAQIVPDAPPRWIVGDALDAATLAPGEYDLLFTCPPYADLEVYSDDPRDLSTMDYADFLAAYRRIVAAGVGMLRDDRFACVCVGDVRGPRGIYRNFVADTIAAFQDAGAMLYNEAILVTAVGSLPIRVGRHFEAGRKLGKTHQNVLVFVKGDWRKATAACGPVEVALPEGLEGAE